MSKISKQLSRSWSRSMIAATALACAGGAWAQGGDGAAAQPMNVVQLSAEGSVDVVQDLLVATLAATRDGRDATAVQSQLQKVVEAALAVVLLVIVGALTSLSPPPPGAPVKSTNQSGSAPLTYQGKMDDLIYSLVINPGSVGMNTFEVSLKERNGQPLTQADGVRLRFTMMDMDMGTQELDLMPVPSRVG